MICNVKANDNVAGLNADARIIMAGLGIPTVDLQTAIVDKCAPDGVLPGQWAPVAELTSRVPGHHGGGGGGGS